VSYRIVVAEDDPHSLYATQRTLEQAGYEVTPYSNSAMAWDAIRGGPSFDLLLTDIRFPSGETHGIALAHHLRAHRRGIPVIFMTGYSEIAQETPEELGQVFLKPIERDTLLDAIRAALAKVA
jgi:CheY-like chemotaxis protein